MAHPGPIPRHPLSLFLLALLVLSPLSGRAEDHREPFRKLPADAELLYLPEKFSACWPCHSRTVFEDEDFNVETGFRDTVLGKNLHWMHVFRQPKGTNCSACHRVDPSTGTSGYAPEAKVSLSDAGGTCAPSCHRTKTYRNAGR